MALRHACKVCVRVCDDACRANAGPSTSPLRVVDLCLAASARRDGHYIWRLDGCNRMGKESKDDGEEEAKKKQTALVHTYLV